jgi:hypothetical protein
LNEVLLVTVFVFKPRNVIIWTQRPWCTLMVCIHTWWC